MRNLSENKPYLIIGLPIQCKENDGEERKIHLEAVGAEPARKGRLPFFF